MKARTVPPVILFLDIDSTINVFKSDIAQGLEGISEAEETQKRKLNIFLPDTEATVIFPPKDVDADPWEMNRTGFSAPREVPLTVEFNKELIQRIKTLIDSNMVEFRWLTSWGQYATDIAGPAFGLGEGLPFQPWNLRGFSDYNQAGKGVALLNYFEKSGDTRPFVVADDNDYIASLRWKLSNDRHGRDTILETTIRNGDREKLKNKFLYVKANFYFGILRNQMDAIEKFVKKHQ